MSNGMDVTAADAALQSGGTDVVAQLTAAAQDWLGGGPDSGTVAQPGIGPNRAAATLVSNILPPIDLSGQGGGYGGKLLAWIQPTIVGSLPIVGAVNIAPYGAANPALGTVVFAAFVGLAVYGAFHLIKGR